ncbi:Gfo/Idh/MocA family oxidoreductase [Croceibacterium sp. LX-88]|uniref:Gfo/Idh/MocA family oxidoreductase n=1 Tax=Croceibacterium selenioxidans TaxID=2838833 RepID=A0ABS5W1F8_9SPHN|nr:Gfo/Idh/MocA family oxidoreductase [Croceibacterium selenioxidans]MBT2133529.1 Gfo/Idh/MocA family oxidoreductase [Croceibacterium selenioxidans]
MHGSATDKERVGESVVSHSENQTEFDRRKLLVAAGLAPLAFSAGRVFAQESRGQPLPQGAILPEPPGNQMRWAIVGLGSFAIGQVIPGFGDAQRSRMTAFVSGNPDKARDLGARFGVSDLYGYDNFDDIARNDEIDCVYIVLPVGLHAEYTIRALKAGKHVLCEKPMASTSAECEAMVAAAQANDRQLGVAYRVHFEPTNLEAERRIKAGEIGTIRHVQCDHGFNANPQFPPHKWRLEKKLAGGGSMFDIGIYGLNTSLMMTDGDAPVEVSAVYSYPRDDTRFAEVEGGIDWRLRLASGISVQGSSSYCYTPYISRQRYFGSQASIEMQPATTYDDNNLILDGNARIEVGAGNPLGQFAAQIDGFSDAARANTPHRTTGEMGLRDLRLIEAMYRSADAGGAVVKL